MANHEKIFVLLIDDDPDIRKYLGMSLSYYKMEIATAGDGKMALALLLGDNPIKPDVIICDIDMPNMDGMEFLDKAIPNGIYVPIIISSAGDTYVYGGEAGIIKRGAAAYVPKPVKTDRMVETINDIVLGFAGLREAA